MAGRSRKAGARYPSGQLKPAPREPQGDTGAKAARATRRYLTQGSGKPELAAYPLGVMCATGDISEGERRAGCKYAWLYSVRYGRTGLAAIAWEGAPTGPNARQMSDAARAGLEQELGVAQQALIGAGGSRLKSVVDKLVVQERLPRWMTPRMPIAADLAEAEAAKRGLLTLAELWNERM